MDAFFSFKIFERQRRSYFFVPFKWQRPQCNCSSISVKKKKLTACNGGFYRRSLQLATVDFTVSYRRTMENNTILLLVATLLLHCSLSYCDNVIIKGYETTNPIPEKAKEAMQNAFRQAERKITADHDQISNETSFGPHHMFKPFQHSVKERCSILVCVIVKPDALPLQHIREKWIAIFKSLATHDYKYTSYIRVDGRLDDGVLVTAQIILS